MPKITVIMPVYNGEDFLEDSINSLLTQTFTDFVLLVLNDNSTDRTLEILNNLKQKDSRISIINKTDNVGPANLRNEGISLAKTEYIALLDADDIALPTRFEKQLSFLKNNPEYGVCGTWFTFFGDKKNKTVKHETQHDALKVQMLQSCGIGNPTVMFKKSHLGDLRFEHQYVPAEDYGLWSQLIAKTKFHNISESLLKYRWHPNNISQTKVENLRKAEVIIKKKQLAYLGIDFNDPNIEYYLNALSLKRELSTKDIIKTIEASKKLKQLNSNIQFYNQSIFINRIDTIIVRTIRNAKTYDRSLYNYVKNESAYFSKIPIVDKIIFLAKSLF